MNKDELRQAAEAMVAYDSGDVDLGEDYNYVADLYTSLADPRTILTLLDENEALRAALERIAEHWSDGAASACRWARETAREALGDAS